MSSKAIFGATTWSFLLSCWKIRNLTIRILNLQIWWQFSGSKLNVFIVIWKSNHLNNSNLKIFDFDFYPRSQFYSLSQTFLFQCGTITTLIVRNLTLQNSIFSENNYSSHSLTFLMQCGTNLKRAFCPTFNFSNFNC